jgi:O-acetyl-ADP-ribose deacetylase (regulator of RNase III)
MTEEKKLKESTIRLVKDDITLMEVDAFVFYARPDLKLGSGFGNAIAVRGGPAIQEELDKVGGADTGQAVVTSAGKLKAKNIIHAVGPAFQEEETEKKLRETTINVMKAAEELNAETVALPAMGSGFYGVAPQVSAEVSLEAVKEHINSGSKIKQILFSLPDGRDMAPFKAYLDKLA